MRQILVYKMEVIHKIPRAKHKAESQKGKTKNQNNQKTHQTQTLYKSLKVFVQKINMQG